MSGARIEPFRALMYDRTIAGDLAQVVAPPYDLIGPARQDALYRRSPFNIVRLELGRDSNRYAEAQATIREWSQTGVLRRAPRPAIFHYTQKFEARGYRHSRIGFIVRIRLEKFGRGRILPHEKTFPAAKQDRLDLLRAIRTNVSSIFGLYSGEHPALDRLRDEVGARTPLLEFTDELGIRNELRAIEAAAEIAIVQREFDPPRILIADGHHRYETALNYQRERRAAASGDGAGFDYTMMTLVACGDPGLVILPTHRVVQLLRPEARASFLEQARKAFTVETIENRERACERLAAGGRGTLLVALRGDSNFYLLRLRDRDAIADALPDTPAEVRDLDVAILHALIFDRIFSLKPAEIRKGGGGIEYTIDAGAALDKVANGAADGAFLMNAPTISDVERVSDADATMPEKSTYFYPKLLTGLVMNPVDEQVP